MAWLSLYAKWDLVWNQQLHGFYSCALSLFLTSLLWLWPRGVDWVTECCTALQRAGRQWARGCLSAMLGSRQLSLSVWLCVICTNICTESAPLHSAVQSVELWASVEYRTESILVACLSHDLTYHLAPAPFVLLLRLSGTVSHLMSAHVLLSQHFVNI